jgi:hypothetical protein
MGTQPEVLSCQSFPVFRSLEARPKNRLERLLSVFADVRADEGITAVMLTANAFLLLGAYYLLKPVQVLCEAFRRAGIHVRRP